MLSSSALSLPWLPILSGQSLSSSTWKAWTLLTPPTSPLSQYPNAWHLRSPWLYCALCLEHPSLCSWPIISFRDHSQVPCLFQEALPRLRQAPFLGSHNLPGFPRDHVSDHCLRAELGPSEAPQHHPSQGVLRDNAQGMPVG